MAATDQTFRSQKKLNIVFGVTSLVMFLTVIWMMVDDYTKEFKPKQRLFRSVEVGVNERLMLDQLPEKSEVDARLKEVVDARKALADKKQEISKIESALTAKREKADTAYRTKKADFDSKMSKVDIATEKVGHTPNDAERSKLQREADEKRKEIEDNGGVRAQLAKAKSDLDAVEKEYRTEVVSKVEPEEKRLSEAEDNLKRLTGVFDRFAKTTAQKTWKWGDVFRELPIIDGFASPVRVQQTKLNDLTIDYGGFRDVPRFDRCTTCHLGIDRPTFDRATLVSLGGDPKKLGEKLDAAHKIFNERQKSGEDLGFDPNDIPTKPSTLKLSKGDVTQFMAHPRLDLFVDPNSPHPMQQFGCTSCHGGQGSSTEFVLASHTPNDFHQEEEWKKTHDWESIHFWDFPMHPTRFQEASCVKCHHQMTDLIRNGVKEEAPKLLKGYNLVRENGCFGCHEISGTKGGRTVGPDLRLEPSPALDFLSQADQDRVKGENPGALRKVGPSLRRLAEKTNEEWTRKWIQSPRSFREDTKMPHFYGLSTNNHEYLAANAPAQGAFPDAEIHSIAYYLFAESRKSLKGEDTYRKYLIKSIDDLQKKQVEGLLSDAKRKELADLSRSFGNLSLLSAPPNAGKINDRLAEQKQLQDRLHELHRNNAADQVPAIAKRLTKVSQELIKDAKPTPLTAGVVDAEGSPIAFDKLPPADAAKLVNGRRLFTEKGCLACHANDATTKADKPNLFSPLESHANFGPNLSRLAVKLGAELEKGKVDEASKKRWLVQWILNPNVHHPRTRMPVTFLTPDDANDVASWLLDQSAKDYDEKDPAAPSQETLVSLARVYLGKAKDMTQEDVDTILPAQGDADTAKAEARLKYVGPDADEQVLRGGKVDADSLKWYIGKKSISRLGCYGCHDLPGFETAKPIGTALNDWGKKDAERLAFEDADAFVKKHFNITPLREPGKELAIQTTIKRLADKGEGDLTDAEKAELAEAKEAAGHMQWQSKDDKQPYDKYFFESLEHHHRDGFLNQKLLQPRSYDYGRTRAWDDRLRMPQFQFARVRRHAGEGKDEFAQRKLVEEAEAREAVMTFILGLVAEPVPLTYVNRPAPERLAEVKGRQVLEKYNCGGCHQIQPGRYEFKKSKEGTQQLATAFETVSKTLGSDHYFPNHNAWAGKPSPFPDRYVAYGVQPREGVNNPVLSVRLAEALRFTGADGATHDLPQSANAYILPEEILSQNDSFGGAFSDLLIGGRAGKASEARYTGEPVNYLASRYEQRFDAKVDDARSVLPPPLVREGERVQPRWLYQFLLNPTPVRPQSNMLLRMPRFNMSADESMALVNYFGAVSKLSNPDANLTFPYLKIDQRESSYWRQKSQEYVPRLESSKLLEGRLKPLEPLFKEQLQQFKEQLQAQKAGLETQRDALKKEIDKEANEDAKKKKQETLTALEAELKAVTDQAAKADESPFREKWKQEDAYAVDAYRLLTNKDLCIKCHSIGKQEIQGAIGPNLSLSAERLRPEWTMYWLANPNRMFTYSTQMPQNFPNDKLQWQESFHGSTLDQVKAVRDALMDLPRLAEMPANRLPQPVPAGGGK